MQRSVASVVALAMMGACIKAMPPAPTAGYGAPYRGTGARIEVKDSRTDWDITEGRTKISSEQALEATGDKEYETRRQIMKDYNARLELQGRAHRKRGNRMMYAGIGGMLVGFILAGVAPSLRGETDTDASTMGPEMRQHDAGIVSLAVSGVGYLLIFGGAGAITYGYLGGKRTPPYYAWHTPDALNRPAYIRQQTETYNQNLGGGAPDDMAPRPTLPGRRPPPPSGGGLGGAGGGLGGAAPPPPSPPRRMPPMRGGRR